MSVPLASPLPTALDSSLEAHLLGLVDYDAALALQERLVYEVSGRRDAQGVLLLCEHPPLITIGREGSRRHVQASQHDLDACEIPVRWVGRGGGAILHSPGQLAVHLILPLNRTGVGVGDFRRRVEEALLGACRDLRVPAKRSPAAPGVWCRGGQLAGFGAAIKNETTCFGAYLNVNPDPGFLRMVESSPPGERVTSLEVQRGRRVEMTKVRESMIRHLADAFEYERVHTYTSHPLLKRTVKRVCLHA